MELDHNINITRINAVYNALEELKDEVVFVGGAVVSLYADREVFEPRPTEDIDVLVEIIGYKERTQLEDKLRSKGFNHDMESGIVCRYKVSGIIVDILPTNDPSIGFNTRWFPEGFTASLEYHIDDQHTIRILPAPYFIATKLEAFKDRGGDDGRTSQDFEDIIFILENRSNIIEEMNDIDSVLKMFLKEEFSGLLQRPHIHEWIDSHVERSEKKATSRIISLLKDFTNPL